MPAEALRRPCGPIATPPAFDARLLSTLPRITRAVPAAACLFTAAARVRFGPRRAFTEWAPRAAAAVRPRDRLRDRVLATIAAAAPRRVCKFGVFGRLRLTDRDCRGPCRCADKSRAAGKRPRELLRRVWEFVRATATLELDRICGGKFERFSRRRGDCVPATTPRVPKRLAKPAVEFERRRGRTRSACILEL